MKLIKKIFKLLPGTFISLLLISTPSCKKSNSNSSEKNKIQNPQLELSFSHQLDKVPLSYLTSVIGTGSGETETFGEQKNLLVFFEEDDCNTCKTVKPFLEEYIKSTGCRIFSYTESSDSTSQEKKDFLKKLGSADGEELTAARLVAFIDGKRVASISGSYDLNSTEKINKFVTRFFSLPPEIKSAELKALSGLSELRKRCAQNEEFVLYLDRFSCPYCRCLEDTARYNSITFIAKNTKAKIYSLTTEHSLKELREPVTVNGKKYSSSFEYLEKSGAASKLWDGIDNEKKKAELIELLTVLKLINSYPEDHEKFLTGITEYALSGKDLFTDKDRNVPSFALSISGFTDTKSSELQSILSRAYTDSGMKTEENLPHRSIFINYFAPSSSNLTAENYNNFLKNWILNGLF